MKITSRILFFIALVISAFLLSIIFLAISDSKFLDVSWLDITERFQTLLGGLGVLVAGLFAYCSSTLEVHETRKKNEEDKTKQKNDIIISVAIAIDILRQQSHARLEEIKYYSDNYKYDKILVTLYKTLKISIPQQLSSYFDHSSLFSKYVHQKITTLISMSNIYIIDHPIWVENRESSRNLEEDIALSNRKRNLEKLSSQGTEKEREAADKEYSSAFIAAQSIGWQRAANTLETINRAALEVMKLLEPTKNWTFDPAPYPPDPDTPQKLSDAKHPTL